MELNQNEEGIQDLAERGIQFYGRRGSSIFCTENMDLRN